MSTPNHPLCPVITLDTNYITIGDTGSGTLDEAK